jgi:hypothetical protein
MNPERTRLSDGSTVQEVLARAGVVDEAAPLLPEAPDARSLVEAMIEGGLCAESLSFLAHALPRREAIWWGWLAAREAGGETPPGPLAQVLEATHAWIADPSDANRRRAHAAAQAEGLAAPASLVALAAFFSGASLAPPDQPPVPPAREDGASALAGALVMAGVTLRPDDAEGALADLARKGVAVGDRIGLWTHEAQPGGPA